jgi:hypothetical protein
MCLRRILFSLAIKLKLEKNKSVKKKLQRKPTAKNIKV